MATAKLRYWAKRPFDYAGKTLDRGQVFELVGARNDEKLIRLGYVEEYTGLVKDLIECAHCGGEFIDHNTRIGHHEKRHIDKFMTPEMEDAAIDREERMLNVVAPIHFENAAAAA